jgi:hypothetical protein
MDLIKLIMEQLTPQLIGRIASALGLDRASTEKAISAVVPTLLSALVGLVSKPGGASRLATMLQQQDSDQLERATSMVGGSDQQALIDHGTGSLASLLGNDALGSLTGALGRFAGTGEGQAKSLLGIAAPLVMGVLRRQQRQSGLDAAGLANLLSSQKDSIAGALPSGLTSLLSGTGLLEGVSDRLRDTGAAATQAAAARVQSAARGVPQAAAQRASAAGGSSMRWAWIVAAIVVLAGLAYYFVGGKRGQEMAEQATQSATQATQQATEAASQAAQKTTEAALQATQSMASLTVGDVDLGQRATSFFDDAKETLEGVTDAASAEAAKPKLQEIAGNLDQITELAGQLPADGKKALTDMVNSAMPGLRDLVDKVVAMPGVGEVLRTTLEPIKTKLEALATA